jgi:hypothetical protein
MRKGCGNNGNSRNGGCGNNGNSRNGTQGMELKKWNPTDLFCVTQQVAIEVMKYLWSRVEKAML